jgi:hypothetical protein
MRKIGVLLVFILLTIQTINCKEVVRENIYLWDVSLSMWGKYGKRVIQQDVQLKLIDALNKIDHQTKAVVVPFQNKNLEIWDSDELNKQNLVDKVKSISEKKLKLTNTNIDKALKYAMNKLNKEIPTRIYLLSDGLHNDTKEDNLKNTLKNLESIAKESKVIIIFYTTDLSTVPEIYKSNKYVKFTNKLDLQVVKMDVDTVTHFNPMLDLLVHLKNATQYKSVVNTKLEVDGGKVKEMSIPLENGQFILPNNYFNNASNINLSLQVQKFENGIEYILNSDIKLTKYKPSVFAIHTLMLNWWWVLFIGFIYLLDIMIKYSKSSSHNLMKFNFLSYEFKRDEKYKSADEYIEPIPHDYEFVSSGYRTNGNVATHRLSSDIQFKNGEIYDRKGKRIGEYNNETKVIEIERSKCLEDNPWGAKINPILACVTKAHNAKIIVVDKKNYHEFSTDALGRVINTKHKISTIYGEQNSNEQIKAMIFGDEQTNPNRDAMYNDQGGHILAISNGGIPECINIFPQAYKVNHSTEWRERERLIYKAIKSGEKVELEVALKYDSSRRPTSLNYKLFIGSEVREYQYDNENHVKE